MSESSAVAYKGLALRPAVFGVEPADFALVALSSIMTWGFTFSPAATAICLFGGYYCARRLRRADWNTRAVFIRFLITPALLAVREMDIPGYRPCLK